MKKLIYPKEWERKKLKQLGNFLKGKGIAKNEVIKKGLPCITYGEIYTQYNIFVEKFKSFIDQKSANASVKFKTNDILFTGSGETAEEIGKAIAYIGSDDAYAGGDVIIFSPKNVNSLFLSYALNSAYVIHQKMNLGEGYSIVHIYPEELKQLIVLLPPINERQKIADILFIHDIAIEKIINLISQKLLLKKALMQQLLTGKKRFKEFRKSKWITVHLGDVFTERVERNQNSNHFELLSITNDRGIVKREEINKIDNSSEDKSNYKIIRKGDIGYNTMRMWQGVSAVSDTDGMISPAYTVVKPNANITAHFFSYLFKSLTMIYTFKRYSQGMVDDTLNCKFDSFSKIKITIPSLKEEQEKIALLFNLIDLEIQILQKKLKFLKLQKKGLMQKLLTGKIRVKVN